MWKVAHLWSGMWGSLQYRHPCRPTVTAVIMACYPGYTSFIFSFLSAGRHEFCAQYSLFYWHLCLEVYTFLVKLFQEAWVICSVPIVQYEASDWHTFMLSKYLAAKPHKSVKQTGKATAPNIIIFSAFFSREKLWICMEYCGGGSLQDIYHGACYF